MEQVVTSFIDRFGYWGVALLIAIENIFPPIPSEVILTFGGFLTTYTAMTPAGVVLFSTLGSIAGAILLYALGRMLPPQRLRAILTGPVGRILKLEACDVEKAAQRFARKGRKSVFYCRCIPILRSLISIPAGMSGMPFIPFLLLTAAGSLIWDILLVGIGVIAGKNWLLATGWITQAADWVKAVLIALAASAVSAHFYKKRKRNMQQAKAEKTDGTDAAH